MIRDTYYRYSFSAFKDHHQKVCSQKKTKKALHEFHDQPIFSVCYLSIPNTYAISTACALKVIYLGAGIQNVFW